MIPPALQAEAQAALDRWGRALTSEQWGQLEAYLRDVLDYNRRANLTAAKDFDELVLRHALDGLAALAPLSRLAGAGAPKIVEVGAGAGFVGISLKIAWPEASVVLVDSSYKRVCFMNWTSARLRVRGLSVVHATVGGDKGAREDLRDADVVIARALAPLPEAIKLTLPLSRPGGLALVYQSEAPSLEDPSVARALASTGGRLDSVAAYRLPREEKDRHLAFFRRGVCTG